MGTAKEPNPSAPMRAANHPIRMDGGMVVVVVESSFGRKALGSIGIVSDDILLS
jgi:hypothetical protein